MSAPYGRPAIDTSVPAPARRYDYLLGGKDNFEADRVSAQGIADALPQIVLAMFANRAFVLRAVDYLARDCGIRQFLDVGCGLPTGRLVHEVAQAVDRAGRIVYVDNDPLVMAHARALMTGTAEGVTDHAQADVRGPRALLADPAVRRLDFREPVAVLLCAVLHFVPDDGVASAAVREIVAALPSGSYVVISHATVDPLGDADRRRLDEIVESGVHGPFKARTRGQVEEYLEGLELVEPGLVSTGQWRPDPDTPAISERDAVCWAAVARVP